MPRFCSTRLFNSIGKGENQMKKILKLIGKIVGGLIGLIVLAAFAVMVIG